MTMQAGGKESAGRHRRVRGTFTLEVEWQGGRVYLHLEARRDDARPQ